MHFFHGRNTKKQRQNNSSGLEQSPKVEPVSTSDFRSSIQCRKKKENKEEVSNDLIEATTTAARKYCISDTAHDRWVGFPSSRTISLPHLRLALAESVHTTKLKKLLSFLKNSRVQSVEDLIWLIPACDTFFFWASTIPPPSTTILLPISVVMDSELRASVALSLWQLVLHL